MRLFRTIFLAVIAALSITAAILVAVEGNLSSIIGYTAFNKGERLFPYSRDAMNEINWMRVQDIHETAEFKRLPENGVWWMTKPWNDRMDPRAAAAILGFTYTTSIVDALPMNNTVKNSMREFGVQTTPVEITLKKVDFEDDRGSTMAKYTLGSTAPWLVDDPEDQVSHPTTYMQSDYYGKNNRILVGTGNILGLFKESINLLRDHKPFLLAPPTSQLPSQPQELVITTRKQKVVLSRDSLHSPWIITSPLPLLANQKNAFSLINNLQLLTADKVYDKSEGLLPDLPESELTKISVRTFLSPEPVVLTIYPPDSHAATTVKATISDRNAIFEIPLEKGTSLPGINNLSLTLSDLRSPYLTTLDRNLLRGISLRSSRGEFPLTLRLREGNEDRSVETRWLYSAEGNPYTEVNEEQLYNFMKAMVSTPVKAFVTDSPADLDIYGLNRPEYVIFFAYKEGDPQTILIGKGLDNKTWYAMESGKPSIYEVGADIMRPVSINDLNWKPKKLFHFSRSSLQSLVLDRTGQPPLVLSYDHLDDSWTATKNGQDETAKINPNKARYYLQALESMKVRSWLPYSDEDARKALEHPVFTLTVNLKDTIDEETFNVLENQTGDSHFEKIPLPEQQSIKKTVTLQIAPAGEPGYSSFYYGRISDSPYFFILDMPDVQNLGASVYEQ